MAANVEALRQQQYQELGALIATTPILDDENLTAEKLTWLGRVSVLVDALSGPADSVSFNVASDNLYGIRRRQNAQQILAILHRAFARAEALAPAGVRGAFIPAGAQFTAYQVIGRVLEQATRDVLVVDPYLNDVAVREFVPLAPPGTAIRLLGSDRERVIDTLRAAHERWQQQYGHDRPLEVRIAARRDVHDRLIVIDGRSVYSLTQSLKDFAARANATAMEEMQEIAGPKIEAYEEIWRNAAPI